MVSAVADIADIHILKGFCYGLHSSPFKADLAASTMNFRAFCVSHADFLVASCSKNGNGPLFYGHRGPVSVILFLISLWGVVWAVTPVWVEKFMAVNEFIIEFMLVYGGYGCYGLRGMNLVPFVAPN